MTAENLYNEEHGQAHHPTSTLINQLIANLGVLNVKIHQYHWYIKGPHFFTLHDKFEDLYKENNQYFDSFAERLIVTGKKPFATLTEYIEHASITEQPYNKKITAETMVETLINDYRSMQDITIKSIQFAGKEDDSVTEDMLIEYKSTLDNNIWTLQAYLGKNALEEEE